MFDTAILAPAPFATPKTPSHFGAFSRAGRLLLCSLAICLLSMGGAAGGRAQTAAVFGGAYSQVDISLKNPMAVALDANGRVFDCGSGESAPGDGYAQRPGRLYPIDHRQGLQHSRRRRLDEPARRGRGSLGQRLCGGSGQHTRARIERQPRRLLQPLGGHLQRLHLRPVRSHRHRVRQVLQSVYYRSRQRLDLCAVPGKPRQSQQGLVPRCRPMERLADCRGPKLGYLGQRYRIRLSAVDRVHLRGHKQRRRG